MMGVSGRLLTVSAHIQMLMAWLARVSGARFFLATALVLVNDGNDDLGHTCGLPSADQGVKHASEQDGAKLATVASGLQLSPHVCGLIYVGVVTPNNSDESL